MSHSGEQRRTIREWFRPPRHLLVLFWTATLVLAAAVSGLSWRIYQQDRALEKQQVEERLAHAADLTTAALLVKLAESDRQLAALLALPDAPLAAPVEKPAAWANNVAVVVLRAPRGDRSAQRLHVLSPPGLPYLPIVPPAREPPESTFAAGEDAEFRKSDFAGAIAAFRVQAGSPDAAVRAGALLRLARNQRKAGQPSVALSTYSELARLSTVTVGGLPAELVAQHARCALLTELGRRAELEGEARGLYTGLLEGRWPVMRATFQFYAQEARRWFQPAPELLARGEKSESLAAGVEALWEEFERVRRGESPAAGQNTVKTGGKPLLLLWRSTPDRVAGMVVPADVLEREWMAELKPQLERQRASLALTDAEGNAVAGRVNARSAAADGPQVVRSAAESQLPWTLRIASADPAGDLARLAVRRRLLAAGFALMAVLILAGSYLIGRAVSRELEVARLQSDFVSAVSHEFRTPLATLRQLSELLAEDRVPGDARRREYYEALRRESERLHRLVESLLDFGKMQAGAQEYRFEWLEPGRLVRTVAEEFAQEARERGYEVEVAAAEPLPAVRADAEALGRALWNLLDNAVKYSPEVKRVWVETASANGRVAIRVRDRGVGIAPAEQPRIFEKFVRGAGARETRVEGTGLGLTMVQQIVAAHGGEVVLESEPQAGSTFTILLPAAKE